MNVWWEGFLIGIGFFLAMIALIYIWLLLIMQLIGKDYLDKYLNKLDSCTLKRAAVVPISERAATVHIPEAEEISPRVQNTISNQYIVTIVPDATVINE